MNSISILIDEMADYYEGDPRRINHFLKVHSFAKTIAELEGLDAKTLFTLEAAAVVHDIGIKISEQKYGSCAGNYQELEGPPLAKDMLQKLGFENDTIERVCFLVGHHHTYGQIDGIDYQILIEADFIVNIFEGSLASPQITVIRDKYFKTISGIRFLNRLYPQ